MPDPRPLDEPRARPRLDRPIGEVGVLAAEPERLVEAAEPLEQGPRIGDVAGLEPPGGLRHLLRPREPGQQVELVGVGLGSPLEEPALPRRRPDHRLEPARLRAAVVVGERDQRRLGRPPAEVSLRGRAGDAGEGELAQPQARRGAGERRFGVAVADHDHLEALAGDRLHRERLECEGEPRLPSPGRDDDGDLGVEPRRPGRRRRHSTSARGVSVAPRPASESSSVIRICGNSRSTSRGESVPAPKCWVDSAPQATPKAMHSRGEAPS